MCDNNAAATFGHFSQSFPRTLWRKNKQTTASKLTNIHEPHTHQMFMTVTWQRDFPEDWPVCLSQNVCLKKKKNRENRLVFFFTSFICVFGWDAHPKKYFAVSQKCCHVPDICDVKDHWRWSKQVDKISNRNVPSALPVGLRDLLGAYLRKLYTNDRIFKSVLALTGSQCRDLNTGVLWYWWGDALRRVDWYSLFGWPDSSALQPSNLPEPKPHTSLSASFWNRKALAMFLRWSKDVLSRRL